MNVGYPLGVTWELNIVRSFMLQAAVLSGHWRQHRDWYAAWSHDAQERGDKHAAASHSALGLGYFGSLVEDEPSLAAHELKKSELSWPLGGLTLMRVTAVLARAEVERYRGAPEVALALTTALGRRVAASPVVNGRAVRVQQTRGQALALLDATLDAGGLRRRARLRALDNSVRELEKADGAFGPPTAALVRAGALSLRGRSAEAVRELRRAARLQEEAGCRSIAAACRWQLGRWIGGDEGRGLMEGAEALLREEGARRPERIVHALAPLSRRAP